jgi:hypothetical protein
MGGFAAIALPWYAWTFHVTGDPLYPFATGLFGNRGGLWTAPEVKFQSVVARGFVGSGIGAVLHRDLQYLRGSVPYDTGLHRSPLSWVLGIGYLRLLSRSALRDRTFIGVAVAGGMSIGLSLLISADPRYLVPAIGPFALCAGLAADWAMGIARGLLGGRLHRPGTAPIWSVFVTGAILWSSASYALDFRSANGNPPTTRVNIAAYLSSHIPCYAAAGYLNSVAGTEYRAWGYSCEQARYYAHGRLIGDAFSSGSRMRIFDADGIALPTDSTLWRRLAPLDVRWAVLPTATVPNPAILETHQLFALAATVGQMDVFRVLGPPKRR